MKNEIMNTNSGTICVFNDSTIGDQFVSFNPEGTEGKIKLFNAINSPDERLGDFINTPISIADVIVTKVKLTDKINSNPERTPFDTNESDGERDGFRVVIIDTNGKSYSATSKGIYNSICTLRNVFGTLHFEEGLKAQVKQVTTKNGNTLTLNLV